MWKKTDKPTSQSTLSPNILVCKNVIFTYSKLGEPFFVTGVTRNCHRGISPRDWTPDELRKMADFMDENPNCKLFNDGSGA